MGFIKSYMYLDGMTMKKCAAFSNTAYTSTAVTWSSYIRDVFMQYVWDQVTAVLVYAILEKAAHFFMVIPSR